MTDNQRSFRIEDIIVYNLDFLQMNLAKNLVDLIITSPPYNIGILYNKYLDNKTYEEYLEFSEKWMGKCFEILKDGGRMCINVPIDTNNSTISADMTVLAKKLGFKYKGIIVWDKQNTRNKFAMSFSKNLEIILIFYKGNWKPVSKIYRDYVSEIWKFAGENPKRVNHPAAFPPEIARRLIKMFSEIGEIVCDPFLGSGTSLVVAKSLMRKGVGVEISEKYFENAKVRITGRNI